jgi:hypothetical protein
MRLTSSFIALAAIALAAPASAGVVFSDNFDAEAGGTTVLNYAGFSNFAVTGNVDLVKSGDYGIVCSGSCVDLDGTTGPGAIQSLASFAFNAGDTIRLTGTIGGSQRSGTSDGFFLGFSFASTTTMLNYGFNFSGSDIVAFPTATTTGVTTSSGISGTNPFAAYSIFFTAGTAGSLKFNIGTNSADNVGPLLDDVKLSINARVPEPAAWAMMLAGFGLVGAAMRRREKVAVSFA